jgi:hypothetical protein
MIPPPTAKDMSYDPEASYEFNNYLIDPRPWIRRAVAAEAEVKRLKEADADQDYENREMEA